MRHARRGGSAEQGVALVEGLVGLVETVARWLMRPARNAASASYAEPAELPKRVLLWALVPVGVLVATLGVAIGVLIGLLVG